MVKGKKTSKEDPTVELAKEFTVEAPQLGIKKDEEFTVEAPQPGIRETSEGDSGKSGENGSEDSKESEEAVEESGKSSEEYEEAVEESGKSSEEYEEAVEDSEKSSDDSEESSEDSEKVMEESEKSSEDSETPGPPAGITDEELSRVFGSLPKKSKVALNRAESKMSSVKSAKSSPMWYPWVFSIIMIIGLIWAVVYYLTGTYPIPHIGVWNLCIAFVTMLVGFSMTMFWK